MKIKDFPGLQFKESAIMAKGYGKRVGCDGGFYLICSDRLPHGKATAQ
jgi:hypothetical protein